jgi:hypothetical protein
MVEESFSLQFDGYWSVKGINDMPKKSGIYCVYAGTLNQETRLISLRTLIYIGESENVGDHIWEHKKWHEWRRYLNEDEQQWFSFAPVEPTSRVRVEAALIFRRKPPANSEYKDSFPFDKTTISTTRKNRFLPARFTVLTNEQEPRNA